MKRLTDTEKWNKKWFRNLSREAKLLLLYILDTCDYTGIWEYEPEKIIFYIGQVNNLEQTMKELKGKLYPIEDGKYLVRDFVSFQYGRLNEKNPVHKRVLERLQFYGIEYPFNIPEWNGEPLSGDSIQITNQTIDNSKSKLEEEREHIISLIPEELKSINRFVETWFEWEKVRKEKRNKLTDTVRKAQFKKLLKQPDPIAVLQQSITSGYTGLFPVKDNKSMNNKTLPISKFDEDE